MREAIGEEYNSRGAARLIPYDFREFVTLRLMPYSVGAFASVIIGLTMMGSLFSGTFMRHEAPAPRLDSVLLAAGSKGERSESVITPADFARARQGLGAESPSLNPQGALVALTRSLVGGEMPEDEVVVVADVFGNGLAHIEEVVQPSRNRSVDSRFQKALDAEAESSPFLPADMESRPEIVRVVFRFQSVNVPTGLKGRRQSL